jgi:acetyltransferase
MGGPEVAAGEHILNAAGIPTFPYPDTAARMFNYMWRYAENLRGLYETPIYGPEISEDARTKAAAIVEAVRAAGRTVLTEMESKQVLACYDIPTVPTAIATTEAEALHRADEFGFPVVLKLYSETITHKTDVGGVMLNLRDAFAVKKAFHAIQDSVTVRAGAQHFQGVTVQPMVKLDGYELIIGSSVDPQFGPVLLFGLGGQLVEVFEDRALGLPPLNTTLARRMIERTKIHTALKGVRGRAPVDLAALEQLMVRFSRLVVEQRWIKEIDINPLLASPTQIVALDARVLLHDPDTQQADLPRTAIRPYPAKYQSTWTLKNGDPVLVRPIRPEDEPMMVKFHESLSERTVYQRYLQMLKLSQRVAHERLTRICFIDYARQIAMVVTHKNAETGEEEILGVGRLQGLRAAESEFAIVLADHMQGQGLGSELLRRLIEIGRAEGVSTIVADILTENIAMQKVCQKLGFQLTRELGDPVVQARLEL